MPGPILNETTLFSCPHQIGQFKLIAKAQTVRIGGAAVLTVADVPGAPFVPCTAPPPPAPTVPCAALVSVTPGSAKLTVRGSPVLTTSSIGTTSGNPPTPALPKGGVPTVKALS